MNRVPPFLEALTGRLAPGCDREVVLATFASASGGYAGPRGRDGRRVTAITPSGVPFEASVTGGAGRAAAAVRYVTETATGMPFFGPRLAAQRRALDDLVGRLPAPARAGGDELRAAPDVFFPDPGAVPARTRFATTFGVVHRPEVPDAPAGLKLYGNLRTEPAGAGGGRRVGDAALGRLAARWPAFLALREVVGDLSFLAPHFATIEVDARGGIGHKVYLRTGRANAAALTVLARRCGATLAPLADELAAAGVAPEVWARGVFVCCHHAGAGSPRGAGGSPGPEVSVHLPARALGLDAAGMAAFARRMVTGHGDGPAHDALVAAVDRAGGPAAWTTTVVGVGLAAGGLGKVNVYVAPTATGR